MWIRRAFDALTIPVILLGKAMLADLSMLDE
jgi:hypothetical protein